MTIQPVRQQQPWHTMGVADVGSALDVAPDVGLSTAQVAARRAEHGPNRLAEAPKVPRWKVFVGQFKDLLIVILIIAAIVSLVVTRELETPLFILFVVVFNAVIGYVQEAKAEASLEALRKMLVIRTKVRRDGQVVEVEAEELVPGDVVLVEAGDRIPADGRVAYGVNLEVEEAALTGESQPVHKVADPVADAEAPLADRVCAVYMNTTVTRGRGEVLVTATGMETEIGHIAGLLRATEVERTPLQRQLDVLGKNLAILAGVVVVFVFVVNLIRSGVEKLDELFLSAVSLAVAAIPEGLPAVVAFTLAMGTTRLAQRGAIVKKLSSVETLGSTSHICSDKTGTLTLNEMTAREVWARGRRFTVSGEGYSSEGAIRRVDGAPIALDELLMASALCADAVIRDGECVGDPTEGALVVLSTKGGNDIEGTREEHPRIAEVPFDSANKFMATFHEWRGAEGRPVVRAYVKGAPDVLLPRSTTIMDREGRSVAFDPALSEAYAAENARMAAGGMRVMALAEVDLDPATFTPEADHLEEVRDLTLLGLVGIVDPPRTEAKKAVAECANAGIRVRMITGDHAATAAAIAGQLGIPGRAVTGAELNTIGDDELREQIDEIGVFARVAPEHKIRIVQTLKSRGDVVSMTGDGVNDAPALKAADIGVAMGITGTEVTKEAATMVLTDDNFATIVRAVREGRGIFDNILKFIRFQLSTSIGFVVTFLLATIFGIASGNPFNAIQILFVNLVMDGPPALALGVDKVSPDVMDRSPRPVSERILTRNRLFRILYAATIMAVGTLLVIVTAPGPEPSLTESTVAGTMAFATFVFFQVFNLLNSRSERRSVFTWETFDNRALWLSVGAVLLLLVLVVNWTWAQKVFLTESLSGNQWALCLAVASSVLILEEVRKLVARRMG